MNRLIKRLKSEHKRLAAMMQLLSGEARTLRDGGDFELDLVRDVLDYCAEYANLFHHPTEDLALWRSLLKRNDMIEHVTALRLQHGDIMQRTQSLMAKACALAVDAPVSRQKLLQELTEFIELNTRHRQYEEEIVFPALLDVLDAYDWRALEQRDAAVRNDSMHSRERRSLRRLYRWLVHEGGVKHLS